MWKVMNDTFANCVELPCHVCGYDLRAHPADGQCPECGGSVAEARRLAVYPRRPAWAASDPRWRRRIIAGLWVLLMVPVVSALQAYGWFGSVPVPDLFGRGSNMATLGNTFLAQQFVYQPLLFCIGVVLLFAKERGRRPARLDWTRRWGILCCYSIALISAAAVLLITGLVAIGIGALFLTLPPAHQPGITLALVDVGRFWLHYGPVPGHAAYAVEAAFASIAVLLACVPLFDALRSNGPRWLAAIPVGVLALFAVVNLGEAAWYVLGPPMGFPPISEPAELYFATTVFGPWGQGEMWKEVAKTAAVGAAAIWLSVAQVRAWWKSRRSSE